ncbi:MAG: HIT family protein [Candidatus Daviesbacteria bacterium]|nr:HIT family protein [Candidatus Daviesbacteria bacterium]
MFNHQPKNYICPLCQIARGEKTERGSQEETVIYRDQYLTAFIAGKWWRSNPGHVIIIPNQHIENIYDLPGNIGHKIFDLSKKVSIGLKETYQCAGVSSRQHNEPAGNQDVWHYHLHIFPRYKEDNLYLNHKDTYWPSIQEKKPYVDKLRAYFKKHSS